MASEVLYGGVFMGFCLLLLIFFHGVHGKTVSLDKLLLHGHRNNNISTSSQPDEDNDDVSYTAVYYSIEGKYYGVKADVTIYSLPQVKDNQYSASEIWVVSGLDGPEDQISTVQAGWHVRPILYEDTKTHFFTSWTADFYKSTGCYNFECPGFVLNPESEWVPGQVEQLISVINGQQWELRLSITKDSQTGDWLLKHDNGKKVELIGYWPKSLFKNSNDYADEIVWGGRVISVSNEPSPPMGSGRGANEQERNASYFSGVQYMNSDGTFNPFNFDNAKPHIFPNRPYCYDLQYDSSTTESAFNKIYYGGPGGCKES